MAKKKEDSKFASHKDLRKEWADINEEIENSNESISRMENTFSKIFSLSSKMLKTEREIRSEEEKITNIIYNRKGHIMAGGKIRKDQLKLIKQEENTHQKILKGLQRKQKIQQGMLVTQKLMGGLLDIQGNFYKYLMDADSAIRSTNLELGLSGEKAMLLRENFYQAGQDSAMLGATLKDMAKITTGFANETGRARVFSGEMLDNITEMGLGTGMGIEGAAQLAGQFDLMGVNISQVHEFTQDVVDTSERMGVNTTKVFKNITTNFKALQKMSFQQGVKGMAEMATYAEKFMVDMGQMIDSADKARTLEGAVEMAASLQVMGGEFAKTDPFELLFLSRNDPAAYTKKINEMTKGVITWKKNAEGGFEKYISPADRDRLDAVGKAMGLQTGELIQQARRMADITKMRSQMAGLGLTKDEMGFVEGLQPVLGKNGIFQVQVGDSFKDVSKLTQDEIKAIEKQSVGLKERAEQALTFDKVFEATANNFKASLLPLLNGVNKTLDFIRPLLEKGGFLKDYGAIIAGIGLAVGGLWAVTKTWAMVSTAMNLRTLVRGGGLASAATSTAKGATSTAAGAAGKAGGAGKGLGIGGAALGIGAGIGIAAVGISSLADSLKDLDVDKIYAMNLALGLVGVTIAGTLVGAILALGAAGTVSSLGLLAIGAAALGIGAGIGIAAAGIGYMAEGFATLDDVDLSGAAKGIAAISIASMGGILGMGGMATMALGVAGIAASADGIERVGSAFDSIGVVMAGKLSHLKDVKDTIQAIANVNMSKDSPMSQLTNLLNKPLQVEFADKDVSMNVELILDGDVIFKKLQSNTILTKQDDAQKLGYNA